MEREINKIYAEDSGSREARATFPGEQSSAFFIGRSDMIKTYNKKNYSKKMGAIHHWIKKRKPRPEFCEHCGIKPPYDCANISKEYKRDPDDYEWLCRSCHQISDGRMAAFKNKVRDNLGRFSKETFIGVQ